MCRILRTFIFAGQAKAAGLLETRMLTTDATLPLVLFTLLIHPTPRQVVDVYVQMPDPWRYVERACPEHWYDTHVLRMILNPDDVVGQSCGKGRGVHNQGWRLVLDGD